MSLTRLTKTAFRGVGISLFAILSGRRLTADTTANTRMRRAIPAVFLLLCATAGLAQQTTAEPPPAPADSAQVPDAPVAAPQQPSGLQVPGPIKGSVSLFLVLQKKSLVFPDLATDSGPMTGLDKFKLAAHNSVSVSTIASALLGAGFSQAFDTPSGYHQGAEGYGKRLGADMARSASYNMFGNFMLATALHEDPRFYVKKNLSFGKSVEYAAVRVLYTRTDSGDRQINYSGLIGPLMAEGLANAYYPDENRTVGATFTRYASDLGWRFAGNLLRQYWPTINHRLALASDK